MTENSLRCSRAECREQARWAMLWNNPKIHTPARRKVWLTCDAHKDYLSEYLDNRGLLKDVVPADEIPAEAG